MTDQSKIPVPPYGSDDPAARRTLIERAQSGIGAKGAGSVDLNRFLPPPIPLDGDPAVPRHVARRRQPEAEAAPQPRPEPEARPVVPPVEALPVQAQSVVPAPVAPAPRPAAAPVRFGGEVHPIDREHLREQGLIVPEGKVTTLLEEFRIVKRQLLLQAADLRRRGSGPASQRVLVSSPHPGEGKTYCAINLALSIAAEKESDVLLVDCDFARPSIARVLGLPAEKSSGAPGLMDALTDPSVDVANLVIGTDIPGLWVLPTGNITASDAEYLSSSRTGQVLERLTEGAPGRIVIFDSSPALVASAAAELARHVGQTVMVVRADQTGKGALEDAVSLLSACPNIELLLNAVHFSPSGRRFGSYGYGG